MQHAISIEGRSLIRTFLARAAKDAAVYEVSDEQAQKKKMWIDLVLSERMITFAPMTGGTGTCHTSDFVFATCVKSIFQDITFSVFAYDINKKGVSLQAKYG